MPRTEIRALFTAIEHMLENNDLKGIKKIVDAVLYEKEEKTKEKPKEKK